MPDTSPLDNASNFSEHGPIPAYEGQESRFAAVLDLLQQGVSQRVFPAASVAITHRGKLACLSAFGHFDYDESSPAITSASIFDLASLTKVLATTSMAMLLYERGFLDLDLPVISLMPEFRSDDPRRDHITVRVLLAHSSGLPAHEKLYLRAKGKDDVIAAACAAMLVADPGSKAEYSDIGFIILGAALERLAEETLDRFCQKEIFGPWGMLHTGFDPPLHWWESIPPTQDDQTYRHRVIQGEVQDENASAMEGVAGHAGLFASAADVALFAHVMLSGEAEILRPETVKLFTQRQASPTGTTRALGWDTPSWPSQSGKYFSQRSFGHLGYTGASLWIDPERELSVTLLTNRTWPDCKNDAIKQFRPGFHDAVVEALEGSK